MTIRYFAADVSDATRIAVVESCTDEFDGFDDSDEIVVSDLPADFSAWCVYERFSHGDNAVRVMSVDGA